MGVTRYQLRSRNWRRLSSGLYIWAGLPPEPIHELRLPLPEEAVFSHLTAAWLHGLDVRPTGPIWVTVPLSVRLSSRSGLVVTHSDLQPEDVISRRGRKTTKIERTIADLSRRLDRVEAVVVADEALHRRLTSLTDLRRCAEQSRPGVRAFRRVIDVAEPLTESPMETRLRMILLDQRLPRPQAQVKLFDRSGDFIARVDFYYPAARLMIGYDGDGHRVTPTEDNRRQNKLQGSGYQVLRYTKADVYGRPAGIAAEVRGAYSRPWPRASSSAGAAAKR